MIEKLKAEIEKLVADECEKGIKVHGLFCSQHEGYAVTLEEVQETEQELEDIKEQLNLAWHYIKQNNIKTPLELMDSIKKKAILGACEAIQVAAMAEKFLRSFDPERAVPLKESEIPF